MRKALFIWELPQLMLGLLLYFKLRKSICRVFTYRHSRVFVSDKVDGAVSLSWLIFLGPRTDKLRFIQHEYGHSIQSLCLGWFYLPLVGIPSIIRSVVWKRKKLNPDRYFKRFPENWADRLGIFRDNCRHKN